MVASGHAFTDGGFHESRERGEYVDRWVDLSVVELSVDVKRVENKVGF